MKIKPGTSTYRAVHAWVYRNLGKPVGCKDCGTTAKRMYHWANISGDYKREHADWKRLCVPCHRKWDWSKKPTCKRNHERNTANTYHFSDGRSVCRPCHRITQKNYLTRKQYA